MAASEIVMLQAVQLAGEIAARRLSCAEVMEAFLGQIERFNPAVNAIVALRPREALMVEASVRDDELSGGEWRGPLHGLPMAAKDLAAVAGLRMTQGSPIFRDFVPAADELMVARLRGAGAVFIGKTNAPEFGLGSHTFNEVHGATRNAYAPARSAGGSSGGAAVSLALRMAPLADGGDYGGSLRNPAGWNNVCGFRTSIGVVPSDVGDPWAPSMGVLGPMARSVADLALLLSVQAGHDPRAPLSVEGDGARFRAPLAADFSGARVAWARDFGGATPCEPDVLEVCGPALKRFETLGCVVAEAFPTFPLDDLWAAFKTLRAWQASARLRPLYDDPVRRALIKPEAIFEIETGMRLSADEVAAAAAVRAQWYGAVRAFFEGFDFLLTPSAQVFPFPIEKRWPSEIAGVPMATYHEWMKANCLITMSGGPALAVPAGFNSEGLPIGLQIVGPHGADLACLRLAHAYETATGFSRVVPPMLEENSSGAPPRYGRPSQG